MPPLRLSPTPLLLILLGLLIVSPAAHAQTTNLTEIPPAGEDPELSDEALLQQALDIALAEAMEIPDLTWIRDFTLITAGGYKDNVTLANQNRSDSPFIQTGFEAFFARLPKENQFLDAIDSFFFFDDIRFTGSHTVEKEQLGFAQATIAKNVGKGWRLSLGAQYLYQDQVIDVSLTEAELFTVQVIGHSASIEPVIRRNLGDHHWLELAFPINRQFFEAPLDDYWAVGPHLELTLNHGTQSRLTASYETTFRRYDSDPALNQDGDIIAGSRRELDLHQARVTWRYYWDADRRWRSYVKAGYRFTLDNADGYFDYRKPFASLQLLYHRRTWELSVEAGLNYYHYPIQETSAGDAQRTRTDLSVRVRLEKELKRFLQVFTEYEFEQNNANDPGDEYSVNMVSGGLNWRF